MTYTLFELGINVIVNHDQTAYIKNRYLGYNIRLVNGVIEYCDKNNESGILFMVDFQKAFDTLN
jgi:hypothetical protein